jgi:hypothetical protein
MFGFGFDFDAFGNGNFDGWVRQGTLIHSAHAKWDSLDSSLVVSAV